MHATDYKYCSLQKTDLLSFYCAHLSAHASVGSAN